METAQVKAKNPTVKSEKKGFYEQHFWTEYASQLLEWQARQSQQKTGLCCLSLQALDGKHPFQAKGSDEPIRRQTLNQGEGWWRHFPSLTLGLPISVFKIQIHFIQIMTMVNLLKWMVVTYLYGVNKSISNSFIQEFGKYLRHKKLRSSVWPFM